MSYVLVDSRVLWAYQSSLSHCIQNSPLCSFCNARFVSQTMTNKTAADPEKCSDRFLTSNCKSDVLCIQSGIGSERLTSDASDLTKACWSALLAIRAKRLGRHHQQGSLPLLTAFQDWDRVIMHALSRRSKDVPSWIRKLRGRKRAPLEWRRLQSCGWPRLRLPTLRVLPRVAPPAHPKPGAR